MKTETSPKPPLREDILLKLMDDCKAALEMAKPNNRSEKDRIYVMCISKIQDAAALFDRHVVRSE